ncbi:hypothetical protein NYR55_09460 [Sphingomonas sp. BGYR3]|uniref:hypothetical protein n=1 Tax=Sphingomonas sp. BGYR3 TaxID=2975483 RepID=UPI0021A94F63|nr:hypothetical protein [Sphingomonas sp. BGYR3]MDG5488840.1 hypothetical protein [Sphingomonas sp. BGYR3]
MNYRFGISSGGKLSDDCTLSKNSILGTIFIGQYSETIIIDTSIWSPSDYNKSWEKSLISLIEKKIDTPFCCSLGTNDINIWYAIYDIQIVKFLNVISKRSKFAVSGFSIEEKNNDLAQVLKNPQEHWSVWDLDMRKLNSIGITDKLTC